MKIYGIIVSGTQKGSFFMSLEVYQTQFLEKLGFKPFPGTLNLDVAEEDASQIINLQDQMGIIKGSGSYGDVKYLHARLNGEIEGALLFPVKTLHSSQILEFVSVENLREKLKLKDGDKAHIEINFKT
jgi:riboflavin kinase